MSEVAAEILELWQEQLIAYGLVFLRIGAIMALLPAFGERSVPIRIRLVLSFVFAVLVMPAVAEKLPAATSVSALLHLGFVEVTAGLAVGILFRLAVLALQMAGTIAANVTSLAQIFGGSSVDPQPAIAHLLVVSGLALAAMAGLHVKFAGAMIASYDLFVPGQTLGGAALADWGNGQIVAAFALAFSLSAPFLVISVIYNLALGAINRAMPQLMVAFVGAPAITGASLVLLLLSAPFLLGLWLAAFDGMLLSLGAD